MVVMVVAAVFYMVDRKGISESMMTVAIVLVMVVLQWLSCYGSASVIIVLVVVCWNEEVEHFGKVKWRG